MALTEEQIKNLKPYDTLILNNYPISYLGTYTSGIIGALDDKAEECCYTRCHFPQQYLSLPPKHDPCRLFKKGDLVRVVEWNGRHFHDRDYGVDIETGCVARIYESEKDDPKKCAVKVAYRQYWFTVPTCFLELVTPVEELEPYIIREYADFYAVEKDGAQYSIFFKGSYHDNAKAAAETECKRLNDEWRKEQNNE